MSYIGCFILAIVLYPVAAFYLGLPSPVFACLALKFEVWIQGARPLVEMDGYQELDSFFQGLFSFFGLAGVKLYCPTAEVSSPHAFPVTPIRESAIFITTWDLREHPEEFPYFVIAHEFAHVRRGSTQLGGRSLRKELMADNFASLIVGRAVAIKCLERTLEIVRSEEAKTETKVRIMALQMPTLIGRYA